MEEDRKQQRRERWDRKRNHKRRERKKNFKKNQKKLDFHDVCFSYEDYEIRPENFVLDADLEQQYDEE